MRPATLLKKRLWHRHFLVNFVKFLRTPFLQNTSGRLLLTVKAFTISGRAPSQMYERVLQKQRPEMFYKVFLEILQNSQEKSCVRPVTDFSCEFCEIFRTTFLQDSSR